MRKRYINETQFLSATPDHNELYLYSLSYERSISSAVAFTTGLYPPGTGFTLY
jgi:hypothetical protein